MLKIKLARFGKRNQPHYRIVINEAKDKRDGSYVEMIGHYIPAIEPKVLELDLDRYNFWISQGAQPTDTVAFLAEVAKSGKGFPPKKKKPNRKAKAKKEEKAGAKEEEKKEEPKEPAEKKKSEAKEQEKETAEEKPAKTETADKDSK